MAEPQTSEVAAPEPTARLETGWFPDTPIDDTLTRQFAIADAEWMESCALAAGQASLRTDDLVAVDDHSPHLLLNTGVLLRPVTPDRADVVAADLMRFFDGAGGPFSLFCPWPTSLPGFVAAGHPPFLLRMPGGERPAPPPELTIEEATTREALGDYEQVLVDGFPLESLQPWRPGVVFHPATLHVPGTRFFVGRVDGRGERGHVDRGMRSEPRRVRRHPARRTRARLRRGRHVGGHLGRAPDAGAPHRHRHGPSGLRADGLRRAQPLDVPRGRALTYAAWPGRTQRRGSRRSLVVRLSPRR